MSRDTKDKNKKEEKKTFAYNAKTGESREITDESEKKEDEWEVTFENITEEQFNNLVKPDYKDYEIENSDLFNSGIHQIISDVDQDIIEERQKKKEAANKEQEIDDEHPAWILYDAVWNEDIVDYDYPECFTERDKRCWEIKQEVEVFILPTMDSKDFDHHPDFIFSEDHAKVIALRNPEMFYQTLDFTDNYDIPSIICREILKLKAGKKLEAVSDRQKYYKNQVNAAMRDSVEKILDEVMQKAYHVRLEQYYTLGNAVMNIAKMYHIMMGKFEEYENREEGTQEDSK